MLFLQTGAQAGRHKMLRDVQFHPSVQNYAFRAQCPQWVPCLWSLVFPGWEDLSVRSSRPNFMDLP